MNIINATTAIFNLKYGIMLVTTTVYTTKALMSFSGILCSVYCRTINKNTNVVVVNVYSSYLH